MEWPEDSDLNKVTAIADTTIVDIGESIGADGMMQTRHDRLLK